MRWLVLAVLIVLPLTGCGDRDDEIYVHRVDRHDHVCNRGCHQHYYDGRRLVALKGHRHGPNCGHRWDGRRWVILATGGGRVVTRPPVNRRVINRPHVCTRGCNLHVHDGRKLIALKGHRHGADCGHRWNGRYWVASATRHRDRDRGNRRVIIRRR